MLQVVFRILGPLDVQADGSPVPVAGARQRTILSMLLLSANRVVSVDALADAVWHGNPPNTFVNQVAICVSGLRKTFKTAVGVDDLIVTMHPGYMLFVGEHRIDAVEFEEVTAQAREAARGGNTPEAVELLDEALAMWRGPALEGIAGERVEAEAARLTEMRLDVYEEFTALRLDLGMHRELVGELSSFIRENGLREQARGHLMLAQYRSGRRAEALETFREGRRLLIDELGIEPGPALKELHDAVLADSPRLTLPAEAVAAAPIVAANPAQLPSDVASFTGRDEELSFLDRLLDGRGETGALPVGSITGIGGVGKTALAVHWAHQVAARFPDGQLFADLRGYDEHDEPTTPSAVLDRFLRALGVPAERIPVELVERTALFRSVLDSRRVLIVLDNARSFTQIRPLLPGSGRCCVLVTSRDPMQNLAGDYGFVHLSLNTLEQDEATELLARVVGDDRLAADPAGTARLSALCDRLPLALRIAAARLAAKPHWSVRTLVSRLEDQHRRLDELSQGERGVRAGFRLSYRDLNERAARMYRLLGLLNVPDFSAWVGAALLDISPYDAEDLIEELVDAQLLEVLSDAATGRVRYRFQDLLRLFAYECAKEQEGEPERHSALQRAHGGWLFLAQEAHRRIYGGDYTVIHGPGHRHELPEHLVAELLDEPMAWFEVERAAIVGVVDQASQADQSAVAWDLTMTSATLFQNRNYPEEWRLCGERALAAARRTGDDIGEAAMLHSLGTLEIVQWRYEEAAERLDHALRLFDQHGEQRGRALVLRNLALYQRYNGDLDASRASAHLALEGFRTAGDHYAEAHLLGMLAQIELERGEPQASLLLSTEAIARSREVGSARGEAQSTVRLAEALIREGDGARAEEACRRALDLVRGTGDRRGEAHALHGLGEAQWRQARLSEAVETLGEALEITRKLPDRFLEARAGLVLACVTAIGGDRVAAAGCLTEAGRLFDEVGAPVWSARVRRLDELLRGAGAVSTEILWELLES
ncbi:AfsR/SARP family transcriptional regulator [Streptomyces sp. NRRL WC-3742]|uniref:AfsR/SARP family transcriptional regulator n=1 Tax=Streptomyces sp. NRRL WC-3742 TaxID=1463934 RepID=UPI00099CB01F|nr:BTAD domain-containing putative transcriptional regulator [Streptomyces sp. NRRL WC-3742]